MDTQQFVTSQRKVEAVQVNGNNMNELAGWCGGKVKMGNSGQPYIQITVKRGQPEKFGKAFITDWIVKMGSSYRVYDADAFRRSFDPVFDIGTPLYDQVLHELNVARATQRPDEATARKIAQLAGVPTPTRAAHQARVDAETSRGLFRQFQNGEITLNQFRKGMGMPAEDEVSIVPAEIMGRPYVPGAGAFDPVIHEVSIPADEAGERLNPNKAEDIEKINAMRLERGLSALEPITPVVLPATVFEVIHEGLVEVDGNPGEPTGDGHLLP